MPKKKPSLSDLTLSKGTTTVQAASSAIEAEPKRSKFKRGEVKCIFILNSYKLKLANELRKLGVKKNQLC